MMEDARNAELPRLEGCTNFRDFGGVTGADGRPIRRRRLFRSGVLSRLTESDLAIVAGLNIGTVCDLRSEPERTRHPSRWPQGQGTQWMYSEISADLRAGNQLLRQIIAEDPSIVGAHRMMLQIYRIFPKGAASTLRMLFPLLIASPAPLLVHCTAGKDRTGFISAAILWALGASREAIYEDYMASGPRLDVQHLAGGMAALAKEVLGVDLSEEVLTTLNGVAPEYLDASFATIDQGYGSMDAYLETEAGLDAGMRERLRETLIET